MWNATVNTITKFEVILFFTALVVWAENILYNLCRWHIFCGMGQNVATKGLVVLNAIILICAVS